MRRAVELAAAVRGRTGANPNVGCVLLDAGGRVVGEGATAPAGGPHAEVAALRAAGARAAGGTAVVTLEPCRHSGRTGPCTAALVAAGVARVVYAVPDPNPVAAGGADELRALGLQVCAGLLADPAEAVMEAWLTSIRLGRPHVTWKVAASLDGRVAAADGSSQWITSAPARADVHLLRAHSDAVLVGSGTVLADDPSLTARRPDGGLAVEQPLRVVADARARTPVAARVLHGPGRALVVTSSSAPAAAVAALEQVADVRVLAASRAGGVDPAALLALLTARDVRAVLLEGGPTLAGAFADAGLVDTVVAYFAPLLLGGGGRPALGGSGAGSLAGARRLRLSSVEALGADVRVVAREPGMGNAAVSGGG